MSVKSAIMSKVGLQLLKVQKHSPKILFAAGVVGFGATVVMASRATLKVEEVLEKHDENMKKIELARSLDPEVYKESNAQQDRILAYGKTIFGLVKLYGPAILVGGASIAALTGSHVILSNRVTNLTAAYAVLDQGWRKYRGRVIEELGLQKDAEFMYGAEEHEIIVETDEGPVVEVIKRAKDGEASGYAVWFDERSVNWGRHPVSNSTFIRSQQQYANDLLRGQGYVFLNDVYYMLGLPKTSAGQVVGWVYNNERGGDNYIDFGVFNGDSYSGLRFVSGDEPNILLDFNVDGVVWDLLDKVNKG